MKNINGNFDDKLIEWIVGETKSPTDKLSDFNIDELFSTTPNTTNQNNVDNDIMLNADPEGMDFSQIFNGLGESEHLSLEDEINAIKSYKTNSIAPVSKPAPRVVKTDNNPLPAPIVEEYEEADYGDTYDNYKPSKLTIGIQHPDSVVESSSLSVVSPPDVTYTLAIPKETIDKGWLSSLQLESVVYACQKHQDILPDKSRAGYLIGDGPGVGKGRIISGIIFENMMRKRTKALWISVSNDLRFDANRDLEDIGCDVFVFPLNKISYSESIDYHFDAYNDVGVLFSTYSSLIGECHSIDSLYRSRMDQILDWLTPEFEGVIVFDECHKAKNLLPSGSSGGTKTANTVLALQNKLPKARVVYCSATGASEPRNMAYMVRLGLWGLGTPFTDFEAFLSSVDKRGVGAMELVAIDMKQRGVYLARQLSFNGVSFAIREIPLSHDFKQVYDESVEWWDKAYQYFDRAADIMGLSARDKSFMLAQFFSSHQRFFKSLCISSKVDNIVAIVKNALAHNKSVVIGLQSTGESKTAQLMESSSSNTIFSTAYGILLSLVQRHFPTSKYLEKIKKRPNSKLISSQSSDSEFSDDNSTIKKKESNVNETKKLKSDSSSSQSLIFQSVGLKLNKYDFGAQTKFQQSTSTQRTNNPSMDQCNRMMQELLDWLNSFSQRLPPNTLDDLIDKLGGPSCVAEMTGRKSRIVKENNKFVYQSRSSDQCPIDMINVEERDKFMDGVKLVAIISEAASSGISLQADKRAENKRKRLHITLELSWSADRVIQQFGRTHRSNQLYPPEYLFVISELAGEKRFACVVAKRLESLGALTHGDRRATDTRDFSQFNIDNKYGRYALDRMMDIICGRSPTMVDIPPYRGDFINDAREVVLRMFNMDNVRSSADGRDKETVKIHKFLNRLLGVKVDLQNAIYQFYTNILEFYIKEAKKDGKYDFGIVDMGRANEHVKEVSHQTFNVHISSGFTSVEIIGVNVERGISYEQAVSLINSSNHPCDGFYISKEVRGRYRQIMLVLSSSSSNTDTQMFTCSRPNTGICTKKDSMDTILKNYIRIDNATARDDWIRFHNSTATQCAHHYFFGNCKTSSKSIECDIGKRVRTIYLLCGAIFSLWNVLENSFGSSPIRMARVTTVDGKRRIGIVIPKPIVERLVNNLKRSQNL